MCNSSWAFAAAAALESSILATQYLLNQTTDAPDTLWRQAFGDVPIRVSAQFLMTNDIPWHDVVGAIHTDNYCTDGSPACAFNTFYFQNTTIEAEENFPYMPQEELYNYQNKIEDMTTTDLHVLPFQSFVFPFSQQYNMNKTPTVQLFSDTTQSFDASTI